MQWPTETVFTDSLTELWNGTLQKPRTRQPLKVTSVCACRSGATHFAPVHIAACSVATPAVMTLPLPCVHEALTTVICFQHQMAEEHTKLLDNYYVDKDNHAWRQ